MSQFAGVQSEHGVRHQSSTAQRAKCATWPLISMLVAFAVLGPEPSANAQAARSTLELRRAEAATLFGPRLEALSQAKQKTVSDHQRYVAACLDRVTKGRLETGAGIPLDRVVIGSGAIMSLGELPPQGSMPAFVQINNETTPTCRMLAHDINVRSARSRTELAAIEEDARRRGVYPGIMRELRSQYGLGVEVVR